jgi:hypothetical protein
MMMLFDPTQDPRFRAKCSSLDPQMAHGLRPGAERQSVVLRQETVLREAATRIRRHLGVAQDRRIKKPLIVVVPKFDIWAELSGISIDEEPFCSNGNGSPMGLDVQRVDAVSEAIRKLLADLCPEFVATAQGLSEIVRYIPVSSLGRSPELVERDGQMFYGIRPKDIRPKWAAVPLLYCLCQWTPGLIGAASISPQRSRS